MAPPNKKPAGKPGTRPATAAAPQKRPGPTTQRVKEPPAAPQRAKRQGPKNTDNYSYKNHGKQPSGMEGDKTISRSCSVDIARIDVWTGGGCWVRPFPALDPLDTDRFLPCRKLLPHFLQPLG